MVREGLRPHFLQYGLKLLRGGRIADHLRASHGLDQALVQRGSLGFAVGHLAIPMAQPFGALAVIRLGKNLMGSYGPVRTHMARKLVVGFQGFRGTGPSCQELLHVDVEVDFVRIRSGVLVFTQEVPQLLFGDFDGVCFKALLDQLARAPHHGIMRGAARSDTHGPTGCGDEKRG